MAYNSTSTHAAPHGLSERFAALVTTLREKAARRRTYRVTLRELNALNTRELADLGLNRSMLTRVAYQAAYES
ncbi:DUF1127 domain-containing protein [Marivita sp. GX14005]|nr:DUF1127 domain-containing protein [Marivita sp. GX14005]MCL3882316.1 DUF1127 domain-containing protein [Marivita sp. GX14005]